MEKISFVTEDGNTQEFAVIEETRFGGINYLLVCESENDEQEETECYILKDISKETDTEACYVFVEDEKELDAVSVIFEDLLSDSDYLLQ